jgi:hypothetical protein
LSNPNPTDTRQLDPIIAQTVLKELGENKASKTILRAKPRKTSFWYFEKIVPSFI